MRQRPFGKRQRAILDRIDRLGSLGRGIRLSGKDRAVAESIIARRLKRIVRGTSRGYYLSAKIYS